MKSVYLIFAINSGAFCGFFKIRQGRAIIKRALDLQLIIGCEG
jgi:hypothetical protein